MDIDKMTLAEYIQYLEKMFEHYGNISVKNARHIIRHRKEDRQ